MIEIERKFLVKRIPTEGILDSLEIEQGYLSNDTPVTRVRVSGNYGWITIKVPLKDGSLGAHEYEYKIPVEDAKALIKECKFGIIRKTRIVIAGHDVDWEVDIFKDRLDGLVVAEVELEYESQPIVIPDWIGEEVTGDSKYYNKNLVNASWLKSEATVSYAV